MTEYVCPACAYGSDNRREFNVTFCPSWPDRCAGCEVHEHRFECPECGHEWDDGELGDTPRRRTLTRQEKLEGLADRGCDTWEEYRGEK